MDDDLYLETNQGKMLSRLSASEIRKRFGNREDPSFQVFIIHILCVCEGVCFR